MSWPRGCPSYLPDLGTRTLAAEAALARAFDCLGTVRVSVPRHLPPVVQRSNDGSCTAQCFGGVPAAVSRSGISILDEWWNTDAGTRTSRDANQRSGP